MRPSRPAGRRRARLGEAAAAAASGKGARGAARDLGAGGNEEADSGGGPEVCGVVERRPEQLRRRPLPPPAGLAQARSQVGVCWTRR